jgi:broad specificity phosphatase PhoE
VSSIEPSDRGGEVDGGKEISGGFVVARGDGAKLLEFTEEPRRAEHKNRWHETIEPALRRSERVLVVAHGNSLRGLVKFLSGIPDKDIPEFEMPAGRPLVYRLDESLRPEDRHFLDP